MMAKGIVEDHDLSVGNKTIDFAHKELLNIISWMYHLIEVEDVATLSLAFETLMDRLRSYFVVEKNIAIAIDFDFTQHNITHQHLLNECTRTEEELIAKCVTLPKNYARRYIDSLKNNLIQHIKIDGAPLKQVLGTLPYDFKPFC